MNNDKDFLNDPIFNELRKFGAKQIGPENMPAELFTAFRDAKTKKSINKWLGRTIVGVGFAAIALPSLSYAHVLPKPINNIDAAAAAKVLNFITFFSFGLSATLFAYN